LCTLISELLVKCNVWCCMLNDAILVVSKLVWNPPWFRLTTGIIWAQVRKFERFGACFCTCALIIWSVLLHQQLLLQGLICQDVSVDGCYKRLVWLQLQQQCTIGWLVICTIVSVLLLELTCTRKSFFATPRDDKEFESIVQKDSESIVGITMLMVCIIL
jgi:hypothetical protein